MTYHPSPASVYLLYLQLARDYTILECVLFEGVEHPVQVFAFGTVWKRSDDQDFWIPSDPASIFIPGSEMGTYFDGCTHCNWIMLGDTLVPDLATMPSQWEAVVRDLECEWYAATKMPSYNKHTGWEGNLAYIGPGLIDLAGSQKGPLYISREEPQLIKIKK